MLWAMLKIKHFYRVARAQRGTIVLRGLIAPIVQSVDVNISDIEKAPNSPLLELESCIVM